MYELHIGDTSWGNSAIKVFSVKDVYIAENRNSFWYDCEYTGIRVYISKQSPEGERLSKLISEGSPVKIVLIDIIFKNAEIRQLIKFIDNKLEQAFEKGRVFQANKIKKALMI